MRKHYLNCSTGEDTSSASVAMGWHRAGAIVQVNTYYNEPHKTGLANVVHISAPETVTECREDENRTHCRHIAEELEAYAEGEYSTCPGCGETIRIRNAGDQYRCPHCGTVADTDDFESLSLYDYFADVFDIEYRIGSDKEYRSVRLMVACGGPNIYIDTASRAVELYWWTESAKYHLPGSVCDEIDSIWEEYFNC